MEKRIYIGGTFDLLHYGHIKLFMNAKKLGAVIVSLNTDDFAERYKRRPILTLAERMAIVANLKCVDEVFVNEGCQDSKPAILRAHPTHIAHGDDWTGEALMIQLGITQKFLDENGIEMLYFPYTKGVSTTDVIGRIISREEELKEKAA